MNCQIKLLADELIKFGSARSLTFITAESCSAGALAAALAKGEGASKVFLGGVVAYTKNMKTRLLDVPAGLLTLKTAVSPEVAEAMAFGAVTKSGASLGVSITGVAGPDPDEDGNPVGLVYCGVACADGVTRHLRLMFDGMGPTAIVDEACVEALGLLRGFVLA